MLATLWRLLRRRFGGRDGEPGCGPERRPAEPEPWQHGHEETPGREEEKPAMSWTERYLRDNNSGGGDARERLRSLPDEQKSQTHEHDNQGRTR